MSQIVGVTFPVPKEYMNRFFEGKDVFVKPATTYKQLKRGMKFVFYQSHEDTGYVGEATIKRIILMNDPLKFFQTYGDRVFLTEKELKDYLKTQEKWSSKDTKKKRQWMAIELEDIKKYDKPVKPKRFVSVGGQYLKE
ncbi:MAG: DUF365 domain-containing protein [Archaeoglobaceae archaeon]